MPPCASTFACLAAEERTMSWRDAFNERFGPGVLCGCTFGDWARILRRAGFRVDVAYWPRAALITGNSLLFSACRLWERSRYQRDINKASVPAPLFVLGIWRSGTTHLHNLLAQDDRFAFPNSYQVLFPHTFLSMESWHAPILEAFLPRRRAMDNVKSGVAEPQEEEAALAVSGLSYHLNLLVFPRTGGCFRRFLTLRDVNASEMAAWELALMTFLRKLTFKYQRPLILKSPGNTARIKLLLDLFPDARFVLIHRHPHHVFQSMIHLLHKTHPYCALQHDTPGADEVIRDYANVYDAYFEQRHLIPEGNFCELAFEDLERDPVEQIRRVYETLRLPAFEYVEPRLNEYVRSLAGYQRNRFSELPAGIRNRLAKEWKRCFEEWGYPK